MFEFAPEAIVVLDPDRLVFVEANQSACDLFGRSKEELLRLGPMDVSSPRQPDGELSIEKGGRRIAEALACGRPRFEWLHRNSAGVDIPCEVSLILLPSEAGRLIRATIFEISARKRAERRDRSQRGILEQLAKGEPLSLLLESIVASVEAESADAIASVLLLDKDGRRLLHGAAPRLPETYCRAIHGLEIGDGVGSCGTAAFTKKRVIVEDIAIHPYWTPFRELATASGLRACWSEPILSSAGIVLGTFAVYHPTPRTPTPDQLEQIRIAANLASIAIERAQAEQTLRANEKTYRDLVETSHDFIFSVDLEGRWTFVNRRGAEKIYGYEPNQMIGRKFSEFAAAESSPIDSEVFASIKLGRPVFGYESDHFHKDGHRVTISFNAIPLLDANGNVIGTTGSGLDVTERKRAEEERRRLESQIQYAQKLESLGVLAGGVAHDFNNLLTSILGYSELALRAMPDDSPARELIRESINGVRRAAELTGQMLAYSGKGRFIVEPLDLSALIEETSRLLKLSISKKCVLELDLAPDLPMIEADSGQIRQVVMNLIINASEAMEERTGAIRLTTGSRRYLRAELDALFPRERLPEGVYVHVAVADNGCGMSAETLARIFDPFFTTKFNGRGLGLAAVLGIVRGHRGAIHARSVPGTGTTFRVLLPASNSGARTAASATGAEPTWSGSGVALVVDDEPAIRNVARRMLESFGFSVLTAADGCEGVEVFRERADEIRLVLLDMTMPRMDGEEAFREMRAIRSDVRAILSSGYNEQIAEGRFSEKGLAAFIQKPYCYNDFLAAVQRATSNP